MPYLIGGVVILFVFFLISFYAFKSALNSSSMAQDLREIKVLLMKDENKR